MKRKTMSKAEKVQFRDEQLLVDFPDVDESAVRLVFDIIKDVREARMLMCSTARSKPLVRRHAQEGFTDAKYTIQEGLYARLVGLLGRHNFPEKPEMALGADAYVAARELIEVWDRRDAQNKAE